MARVLSAMAAAERADDIEDAEIACEGLQCWIGCDRISRSTVNALLRLTAVSDTSLSEHGIQRYSLNDVGRALHLRPEIEDEVRGMLMRGKQFTIYGNRVVRLESGDEQRRKAKRA